MGEPKRRRDAHTLKVKKLTFKSSSIVETHTRSEAIMGEQTWLSIGAIFAFLTFLQNIATMYMPHELSSACKRIGIRLYYRLFSREVVYTVEEYEGRQLNELYAAVELHLTEAAAATAHRLRLTKPKKTSLLTCNLAECEGVVDVFKGSEIRWDFSTVDRGGGLSFSWKPTSQTSRQLHMRIHPRDRSKIISEYIPHILDNARTLKVIRRERKLYTNVKRTDWWDPRKIWESIPFQHPANFNTLALDPFLKQKIVDDLTNFKNGSQFYKDAGRAWKRGYLLYGPPGTGKSSMIASMANFLEYDVYDLELTEVKTNADLRNLLLNIGNKAVVVIEDIDCTLDLSERRKAKKKHSDKEPDRAEFLGPKEEEEKQNVTMSGLLNFTDGLWSSCGSERIFVFTTNHIEKLDSALLRSGRMDMHIHLSFCGFEAFTVLAKNYLKLEDHVLFEEVHAVMEQDGVCMTPADISEVLTRERSDPEQALRCLIEELRASKLNKKVQEMSEQKLREGRETIEEEEAEGKNERKLRETIEQEAAEGKKEIEAIPTMGVKASNKEEEVSPTTEDGTSKI